MTETIHAPQPGETLNIDLCVVPLEHAGDQALIPASLGQASAGVTPMAESRPPVADWPGHVFANADLSYEEQMQQYANGRAAKRAARQRRKSARSARPAAQAELHAQEDELRLEHRRRRLQRQQEDAQWKVHRQAHRQAEQAWRQASTAERQARRQEHRAQSAAWVQTRTERRALNQQRQLEDAQWRQARHALRTQLAALQAMPFVSWWLAILVIVDNCSRVCYGLPLFISGVNVTAEEVVEALRPLCPPELRFILSDNGTHFTALAFADLMQALSLLHVRTAPHRPRTNGIAERFVRTLKEWLETHTWAGPEELHQLLVEFIAYYNDRPHQADELNGLSPNEFARRRLTVQHVG